LSNQYEIIYVSRRSPGVTDADVVDRIVLPAGRTNRSLDITGCLWFDSERFLQVLEGPRDDVERIYARIQEDPRHTEIVVLSSGPIASRSFERWGMRSVTGEGEETIDELARHFANRAMRSPKTTKEKAAFRDLADRVRARLARLAGLDPDEAAAADA
jgi:hypothetical protein